MPTREFRIDDYGAPRYPELVLASSADTLAEDPELLADALAGIAAGYELLDADPRGALDDLLAAVPGLGESEQRAQLEALLEADAFGDPLRLERGRLAAWARWGLERGILARPIDLDAAFPPLPGA